MRDTLRPAPAALTVLFASFLLSTPAAGFTTLQGEVNAASPGDTVLVPPGVYSGPGNRNVDFGGKNLVLLAPAGPESTFIACTDSARAFLVHSGEDTSLVIEGFTILDGSAGFDGAGKERDGGGIWVADGSSVVVRDCVFRGCRGRNGGAGAAVGSSLLVLRDCLLEGNSAVSGGGGAANGAALVVERCTIRGNTGSFLGGGLSGFYNGDLVVRRSTIEGNQAGYGGGIAFAGPGLVAHTDILDNAATDGGGISASSGFHSCRNRPLFRHCTIAGNVAADEGGGIEGYCFALEDCTVSGNAAATGGGACATGTALFTDSRLTGNRAARGGGAAFAAAESGEGRAEFAGCTLSGNDADLGGGLHLAGPSRAGLLRTILWGNCDDAGAREAALVDTASSLALHCSDVDLAGVAGPGSTTADATVLSVDPLFCAPASCALAPTVAGDYTLADVSACLPAASPCDSLVGALGQGCVTTGLPGEDPRRAERALLGVYPNPSRGPVRIAYAWPAGDRGTVEIFDAAGRRVFERAAAPGSGILDWDGRDRTGHPAPSGVYFVRLRGAHGEATHRFVMLD